MGPGYYRGVREERAGEENLLTLFIAMARAGLGRVVNPVTAQQIAGIITGCKTLFPDHIHTG
jgi:hypothetical protein